MWREPFTNINTICQHATSMHHTNDRDHIMRPKLSGHPIKVTNLSYHLKKIYIQKVVGNSIYYARAVNPTILVSLVALVSSQ